MPTGKYSYAPPPLPGSTDTVSNVGQFSQPPPTQLRPQAVDTGIPTSLPPGTTAADFIPASEFAPTDPIAQPALPQQDPFAGVDFIKPQPQGITQQAPIGVPEPVRLAAIEKAKTERVPLIQGLTEQALTGIDELLGKAPQKFRDPSIPLTPAEQTFEELAPRQQVAGTALRTVARGAVGVAGFIPSLIEKLVVPTGKPEHELDKGKAVGDLQAFINELPISNQINTIVEELKGIVSLVGDVPAQLDYALMRAIGQTDPSKNINPDNPLVRAYEGITGKPFSEYYKNAVNNLYSAPESLAFGVGIGKGIFKAAAKRQFRNLRH